jgi:phospholipase C
MVAATGKETMTMLRHSRRRFLKSLAASGGAALLMSRLPAAAPIGPDLQGLRDKVDHIIVIFQENRSFDHYFGAYQPPHGGAVVSLLDHEGRVDTCFSGLQKNMAGVPSQVAPRNRTRALRPARLLPHSTH